MTRAISAFPDSASGLVWSDQLDYEVNIGFRFHVTTAAKFAGMRWWRNWEENQMYIGKLYDTSPTLLGIWVWAFDNGPFETDGSWINYWAHPRVPLNANQTYLAVMYCYRAGYWVETGGMDGQTYQNGPLVVPAYSPTDPAMGYAIGHVHRVPDTDPGPLRYGLDVLIDLP
jgi:hypothetical protein